MSKKLKAMDIYNYWLPSNSVELSFDCGQVKALNIEQAKILAIEKLNQDFQLVNDLFNGNENFKKFEISFSELEVNVKLANQIF